MVERYSSTGMRRPFIVLIVGRPVPHAIVFVLGERGRRTGSAWTGRGTDGDGLICVACFSHRLFENTSSICRYPSTQARCQVPRRIKRRITLDRKSTRLNSSHL